MAPNSNPKQGDHVFNEVAFVIMRPFETIRTLGSAFVQGKHFLYDYILHSYSWAKQIADAPALATARQLTASADADADALRVLNQLKFKYPALARTTPSVLRDAHSANAVKFGTASRRFERELLATIQLSLEATMATAAARAAGSRAATLGIVGQQMLSAAL